MRQEAYKESGHRRGNNVVNRSDRDDSDTRRGTGGVVSSDGSGIALGDTHDDAVELDDAGGDDR
jgi:hypothetical protein